MTSGNANSKVDQKGLRVLQLIHANRNGSRKDLAKQSGFSAASITAIVQRLIDKGLVTEFGESRRPVSLSVRNDLAYIVGVDVGSFLLRVIVTDVLGHVVYSAETEAHMSEGREQVISKTFKAIHEAMNGSRVPKDSVRGIGMAHSGVIDSQKGIVLSFPRPGQMTEWRNVPLRDMLEAEFGLPSVLDDSARMMAIAEKHVGLGIDISDFVYIEVGMGIGAAIFIDDKLYRGPGGGAGEFGHMTVDEKGPLCCCGNTGCLETLASCAAIIQGVKSGIQHGVNSRVSELAQGDLERISVEMIIQAANENDTLAYRVLHEAVTHIGVALADVVNLLNPSVVVFGGPLFRNSEQLLLEPLKRVIRQCALEKSANELELKVSTLGNEAGALGAARLMSERVLEDLYREKI